MRRTALALSQPGTAPFDAVVSGGGLVGAAAMASLQQLRQRLRGGTSVGSGALEQLLMVDVAKRPVYDANDVMHRLRTVSITPVSSRVLDNLGGWARLTTKHPYYRIAIRHEQVNGSQLPAHDRSTSFFMSSVLGSKADAQPLLEFTDLRKPVGFMCYNAELGTAMTDVVEDTIAAGGLAARDVVSYQSTLSSIRLPPRDLVDGPMGKAVLERSTAEGVEGKEIEYSLLLGCEGRGSPLRDVLSTPSVQHDYAQTAFVCEVRIEKHDDGNACCFQNFFRSGEIVAFLPMSEDSANIVFTTHPDHAARLLAMSQQELVAELNQRLHAFASNDIPKILEVPETEHHGQRRRANGKFPLKLNVATTPYASRAVLLGDAAHGIHPFAGQGLNLGIYDVCALTDVLEGALRAGQDVGNPVSVGQAFAGEMLAHTAPMIAGMEAIKQMVYGMPGLSCLGMKALNTIPVLSTFAKDAIFQVSSGAMFANRHKECFLLK